MKLDTHVSLRARCVIFPFVRTDLFVSLLDEVPWMNFGSITRRKLKRQGLDCENGQNDGRI